MSKMQMAYLALASAIVFEVVGTSLLQKSEQFTRLWPSVGVVLSYAVTFYALSLALKSIPLGIAYGIWGGLGIVLVTAIGVVVFKQSLDLPAIIGMVFIVTGVIIVNVFSNTVSH